MNRNRIICNPMNLSYVFSEVKGKGDNKVAREAADPTLIMWKGEYLLFPSMSNGFWKSKDLVKWDYVERTDIPVYDYAPDIQEVNGSLYFTASSHKKGVIYRVEDPEKGEWKEISRPFAFWDPNMFQDEDGRVYFYWGCSNKTPIYGIELDPRTMEPIGERRALIEGRPDIHGWERTGVNNVPDDIPTKTERILRALIGKEPYIEGAYMTKRQGRYYLQYAAPGTELAGYGDGVYVSDAPLGPFAYQESNPFCSKQGGFVTAAGHGSTFMDAYGNWWHVATVRISLKYSFERRLGLFPAGFDEEGNLYCNTNFGDYPMRVPEGKWDPWKDAFAGWMLLSYGKNVTVSSEETEGSGQTLTDEDIRTFWTAKATGKGEWGRVDLGEPMEVSAIQLNFYEDPKIRVNRRRDEYHGSLPSRHLNTSAGPLRWLLEGSADGECWEIIEDRRETAEDLPHDLVVLPEAKRFRYIRIGEMTMPYGARPCMSGIRVFGKGNGNAPKRVSVQAKRTGPVSAQLSWEAFGDADGYNVRFGSAPDRLYHSWMVYGGTRLEMNCLNAGGTYYFAVDAFNENGITEGEVTTETREEKR